MTKIKKLLSTFWLSLFILSMSLVVSAQQQIKAGKVFQQSGVTITSPNRPDWQLVKSGKLETVLINNTTERKFNAFARTMTIDVYDDDKALFQNLEKMKTAEISSLKRDSLHFNNTEFKETLCVQYDGIFDNDDNYKYFNMYGYLCRHPSAKNVLIQVEFSNYSKTRGFTRDEIRMIKDFFENIKFSKVTGF